MTYAESNKKSSLALISVMSSPWISVDRFDIFNSNPKSFSILMRGKIFLVWCWIFDPQNKVIFCCFMHTLIALEGALYVVRVASLIKAAV